VIQDRWRDDEAAACVGRYAGAHGEDVALRVYSSRLIGSDPALVLHGGGNTSVKMTCRDALTGEVLPVMAVKGSGSDLAAVEPRDLPLVRLTPLLALRGVARLGDEEMVNRVRGALLDASAPNPSVEALLHAFLPHSFVDHTHADAILVVGNQPDGEALLREAVGEGVPILPWTMPGHPLAEAVAVAHARAPHCEAIVLRHHGVFSFGASARESYARMIAVCDRVARFAARRAALRIAVPALPRATAPTASEALPALRGALAGDEDPPRRVVLALRDGAELVAASRRDDAALLCAAGPLTPDHILRTKGPSLFVPAGDALDPQALRVHVARYVAEYREAFARHAGARRLTMLDPRPKVALVEGLGAVGIGDDAREAAIVADIAECTVRGKVLAQAIGRYEALPPHELFEMEYWSLEQQKLGKRSVAPLGGQVALLTGAAGAIGFGIAQELLEAGACVVLTDHDAARLETARARLAAAHGAGRVAAVPLDVTDEASVAAGFVAAVRRFGGVDILVPNAGIAHVSTLAAMDLARFRRVLEVNLVGVMLVLREAAKLFALQRSGGCVVLSGSKNVPAPGAGFGAYSASKAGATQLARVAALELAPLGVRVNTIHADAVFGDTADGDAVESGLWAEVGPERMRARGLDPAGLRAHYRERSLLKRPVRARDVGRAVVFFAAHATRTTGAALPVDGGLPEAFPR
jgi:rhamnose utilization protein RhaD (predicted bifunctional aldolase and dehydrogenase)/NAD(P)-dependent dehydrogenase (short-subunit alcohol dehydrogenase family)